MWEAKTSMFMSLLIVADIVFFLSSNFYIIMIFFLLYSSNIGLLLIGNVYIVFITVFYCLHECITWIFLNTCY